MHYICLESFTHSVIYSMKLRNYCIKQYLSTSRVPPCLHNYGTVLAKLGRFEEAIDTYNSAIKIAPNYAPIHNDRGNALFFRKRYEEALAAYDKALSLKPNLADAWLGRGNAFYNLKRYEEALAAYDKALSLKPDLAGAWLGRGNVFYDLKRYEEALAAYDKALSLKPDLAGAWLGRGNVFYDLKRYEEALAAYDKALPLKPDLAGAWLGRGNVFYDLKRYVEALAAYDKALALMPDLEKAWLGRGNTLTALKRAQESIMAYRQALTHGGDIELIRYALAALGAESPPIISPERYIACLFDGYADNFDRDLIDKLKYQTPTLLGNLIEQFVSSNSLDILDLGCGTGLMGERLRSLRRTLTGVDLSTNMIEKARQRKIYDHLSCTELTRFLQMQEITFDLIVATDVFVYIGDLSVVFKEVRRVLRDSGLFCFSVEATDEIDFVLRDTRRYAHSIGYLQKLADEFRFNVGVIESQIIRQDAGVDINGYLAIMRCV